MVRLLAHETKSRPLAAGALLVTLAGGAAASPLEGRPPRASSPDPGGASGMPAGDEASEGALSTATESAAEDAGFPKGWLAWSPPPECPTEAYIEDRIREWLGTELTRETSLRVRTRLTWRDQDAWDVEVHLKLDGREGVRHITVERCSDAADFVALTVALAVNPELAGRLPGEGLDTNGEKTVPPSPLGDDTSEPEGPEEPPNEEPAATEKAPLALVLGAAGELDLGMLPSAQGGLAAAVGVSWPHWLIMLEGSLIPATSESVPAASGPIEFSALLARARGCYRISSLPWSFGPCISVDAGLMQGEQTAGHVAPPRAQEPWIAVNPGLQGEVSATAWLAPFAAFEATIPLHRARFVLDDGTLVHQAEPLGFRGILGVRFFLPLR